MGKKTVGFITEMSQPLGLAIGNWVEVVECVECLRGKNIPDLMEVTYVLGGAMLHLGGKASSIEEGMKLCRSAIWSGKAYEKFLEITRRQGGDVAFLEQPGRYPVAAMTAEVRSDAAGYVSSFETMRIGLLAIELGAGRKKVDDVIDPVAGILLKKKAGDRVEKGEILAEIRTSRPGVIEGAVREFGSAVRIADAMPGKKRNVHALIDATGEHLWDTPALV
jgi:pyrimidine-nucleoside phosphorylase